jgi:5'-nucleotidase
MEGLPMMRVARGLVGSIVVTALLAGPALAQGYPPGAQTLQVSDSTVNPCDTITVSGSNYQPGSTVDSTFDGAVIATASVGADASLSVSVTIPCDTAPGTYVLAAGGATSTITVLAAGGGGGAVTGANIGAGILILSVLFILGVTALVATRRRLRVAQPQRAAE